MSIHAKVIYAVTAARSRLVYLRSLSNTPQHKAALSEMVNNMDRMIQLADEVLPVHQAQRNRVRDAFGLASLEVGQSIETAATNAPRLRVAASKAGKSMRRRFTVRAISADSVRCTRLEDVEVNEDEVF